MNRGLSRTVRALGRWTRRFLAAAGAACLLACVLSCTRLPWRMYRHFLTDPMALALTPGVIVVLGGGGIPSESGLVRAYHGAELARVFTNATVVVSLPGDEGPFRGEPGKMREELVLRGVGPERILVECGGLNTRGQALGVLRLLGEGGAARPLLLVTSPDHTLRALLTFRKAGFAEVAASAAYPESIKVDVRYDDDALGGSATRLPDVGGSLTLRYLFWTNLSYLTACVREAAALGYYRLRGWV